MVYPRWTLWFCCVMTAFLPGASDGATSARQVGFVLLREGVGARAAAMGEAYTAVTGDQTAAFWNPAGIGALEGKDFLLTHHRSFQGIQQGYGGWAYGNGTRGIALSLGVHGAGGLEARTGPSARPLGTFSLFEATTGISYAQRFGSRVYGGFSVRALHERIGPEQASGLAADVGALYRPGVTGLTLGAAYRNLGRMDALDAERAPLPRTLRVGAALVRGAVTASADLSFPDKGSKGVHLGVEYAVRHTLFLRGGYRSGSDVRDLSLGVGLQRRNWRVDYAFVPSDLGLGGSHRIALGIR